MLPILIVDDEPHIARLIEMTLEPLGQPLVLACDGEQAADLLEKQQFDLVLLDVMLPGVDGFALMDYIAPTGTPVIFLTAKNAVADRVRGSKDIFGDIFHMKNRGIERKARALAEMLLPLLPEGLSGDAAPQTPSSGSPDS